MKLCIECKHHKMREELQTLPGALGEYHTEWHLCWVLKGQKHPVVGGEMTVIECSNMRLGPCGLDGKFWELKS